MARTGTKEWSDSSFNIQDGCENDCRYCYAKANAMRFQRTTVDGWKTPKRRKVKGVGKRKGRIMFPTTHDITVNNVEACAVALIQMLGAGNEVLIVSKPDPSVIAALCEPLAGYKDQVTWRFTIGSMFPDVLALWEPRAPTFAERLDALMSTHRANFETSVSIEPMLDTAPIDVIRLVNTLAPFVTDSIWIGRMNNAHARVGINGNTDRMIVTATEQLVQAWQDPMVRALHAALKDHSLVRWKDSIKKVLGLPEEDPG